MRLLVFGRSSREGLLMASTTFISLDNPEHDNIPTQLISRPWCLSDWFNSSTGYYWGVIYFVRIPENHWSLAADLRSTLRQKFSIVFSCVGLSICHTNSMQHYIDTGHVARKLLRQENTRLLFIRSQHTYFRPPWPRLCCRIYFTMVSTRSINQEKGQFSTLVHGLSTT